MTANGALSWPGSQEGHGARLALVALIALFAYAAFALPCATVECVSPGMRGWLGNGAAIACNLVVITLSLRNARHRLLPGRVRSAWSFIALAYASNLVGNLVSTWLVVALKGPVTLASEALYFFYYPFVFAAILHFPLSPRSRADRLRLGLDVAAVVTAGAIGIWYAVVQPELLPAAGPPNTATAFVYSLGDLTLLAAIATIWLGRERRGGPALVLLSAGLFLTLVTDVAYAWQLRAGSYQDGGVLDSLWLVAGTVVAFAAERHHRSAPDEAALPLPPGTGPSLLPYLAIAFGYGLLLWVGVRMGRQPLLGLILGALGLTGIVVARQVVALRDNLRLLAEAAEARSQARFRALVQHSSDVISILDTDTTIRFASPAAAHVLGAPADALVGSRLADLVHAEDREEVLRLFRDTVRGALPVPGEWRLRHAGGAFVITENVLTNLLEEPSVAGLVLNTRDVTERRRLEEQLTWQAFHDPLTDLPNRWVLLDRVGSALARSARSAGEVALLFVDLDDFKVVNDSLGHSEGDRLLVAAGERLRSSVRGSDTVARLGGDEFALLIEDPKGEAAIVELAERVLFALAAPFELQGQSARVGASIGIARSHPDQAPEELLRNADVAMYAAKARGKGGYQFFAPEMHAAARSRLEGEADLRRAFAASEFCLHYQPILRLADRRIDGFEALLRWRHPTSGLVRPDLFIPLAEETGLIVPLGRWALREAGRQWRAWRDAWPGSTPPRVSVNVSGRQFQDPSLVGDVRSTLAEFEVPGSAFTIEITESILMKHTEATLTKLRQLKGLGVSLALDDFGTGYSCLGYLQRFPIDVLKIDKTFVDGVAEGTDRSAIARAIVGLSREMKKDVVAEGIEREEQAAALVALGCEFGQGYLFARPAPPEELEGFLGERRALPEA